MGETRGNRSGVNPFGGKSARLGQILSCHALLRPRSKKPCLLNHSLRGLIEPVAMAIRAIHYTGSDDRIAAFANFEIAGGGDDFFGTGRTVGEMGVFGGHEINLSASKDVEKGVNRVAHRFTGRFWHCFQKRRNGLDSRFSNS